MFPFPNLTLPIDSIYEKLLENIKKDGRTKDISQDFLALTEPYEKVFFVYKMLKNYNLIPLVFKEDKCENVSSHYRNLGNKTYQRGQFYLAWQYYNLAMMYAPLESESFALALSNRSAVFASLKKYKECLSDIEMVFTSSYPISIKDKLNKRKKSCEKALQEDEYPDFNEDDEDIKDIFTFKGTRNEKYVDASSKLRVKYTPDMGRHVIAEQDIKVGEILVQEEPYVCVLLKEQIIYTCANCFSRTCNLYPCPYCCMSMYCSKKCVIEAWEQYHFFECPLLAFLLNNSNFTKLELLALRATIKTRMDHQHLDSLFLSVAKTEACKDIENLGCKKTADGKLIYSSKNYESVHTLATNVEKRDVSDLFQKTVSAAVLMHVLAVKDFIKHDNPDTKKKIKIYTANTLMRHLMTAPTNMHGITANIEDDDGNYISELNIGSGAYPFLSLINHSCAPNVVRFTKLGKNSVTLFALRPIKKGEQIFDNYGYFETIRDKKEMASQYITKILPVDSSMRAESPPTSEPAIKAHHAVHTREDRQKILRSQYKFTCICEACTADFPLYQGLNPVPTLPANIVARVLDYLNGDAIEVLQKGVLTKDYSKIVDFKVPGTSEKPTATRFYCGFAAADLQKDI
ncbi:hypothetical protein PYW08_004937 [Mythimna loreyi]|uniref:Uncharacterized protein n=1 Tax=Mythimna loreyi TaxID=667449 RepID=A0ACC2QET0_9NEOP|nr:hypothetical protein PYW08_004937 [Mythimna loreyi]